MNRDVVGNDFAAGVLDGRDALDGDGAGDGLDDAYGCVLKRGAAGAVEVGCANGVDKVFGSRGVPGVTDEDLSGLKSDVRDRAIFEVDEAGPKEEEKKDERDHHIVVKAAALVGPEEVAAKEAGWITHVWALSLCLGCFAW